MPPIGWKPPDYMDPSVTDSWWTWAKRQVGKVVGADDPAGAVMGMVGAVEVPAAKAAGKVLKAFHGSPHEFERFDLAKVGTGEGGQMFGHGLYFAENEAVAKTYRDNLSNRVKDEFAAAGNNVREWWKTAEQLFPGDEGKQAAWHLLNQFRGKRAIPEALAGIGLDAKDSVKYGTKTLTRRDVEDVSALIYSPGRMYEVEIAASPDELLDWDKPLSEQPERVRQSLGSLGFESDQALLREAEEALADYRKDYAAAIAKKDVGRASIFARAVHEAEVNVRELQRKGAATGEDVYSRLVERSGGRSGHTEGIASAKLKEAGIPGIRYLDQGSRITAGVNKLGDNWFIKGSSKPYATKAEAEAAAEAAGNVTRNFVIFDDARIRIARKYGIPLAVLSSPGGRAMLESLAKRDAQQTAQREKIEASKSRYLPKR